MNFPPNFGNLQPGTCIYPTDLSLIQSLDPAHLLAMSSAIANQVEFCRNLPVQSLDFTNSQAAPSALLGSSVQYNNINSTNLTNFQNISQCLSTNSKPANKRFSKQDGSRGRFRPYNSSANPMFYCELCKISCAGPAVFKAHQAGQRHMKRLSQLGSFEKLSKTKISGAQSTLTTSTYTRELRCELCDITCNGVDSYAAHLAGRQHKRTVRLHKELGKPIPDTSNPLVPSAIADLINGPDEDKLDNQNPNALRSQSSSILSLSQSQMRRVELKRLIGPETPPVGQEYIETINNGIGKTVSYHCKLCNCDLTNVDARTLHLRGRRHRLQYKNKIDPSYPIEVKPNYQISQDKPDENQNKNSLETARTELVSSPSTEPISNIRVPNGVNSFGCVQATTSYPSITPSSIGPSNLLNENRYVTLKHSTIIQTPTESKAMMLSVSVCERALKLVGSTLMKEVRSTSNSIDLSESICPALTSNKSEEHTAAERLLCGVVRVNALGKNLLLRGEYIADLVLVCSHWPTKDLLKFVSDSLVDALVALDSRFNYNVDSDYNSGLIVVTVSCTDWMGLKQTKYTALTTNTASTNTTTTSLNASVQSETDDKVDISVWPVITVNIYLTSPAVFNEDKNKSDVRRSVSPSGYKCKDPDSDNKLMVENVPETIQQLINGEKIPKDVCVRTLNILDQTNHFQVVSSRGGMLMVSRILRAFFQSNEIWSNLNHFDVELHLEQLLTSERQSSLRLNPFFNYRTANQVGFVSNVCAQFGQTKSSPPVLNDMFSPVKLLRRFFESFASGYLLSLFSHRSHLGKMGKQASDNNESNLSTRQNRIPFSQSFDEGLTKQVCESITLSAQHIVRQIAFKQLYKVLGMRKLSSPTTASNTDDSFPDEVTFPKINYDCTSATPNNSNNNNNNSKRKLYIESNQSENVNELCSNYSQKPHNVIYDFPAFKSSKTN